MRRITDKSFKYVPAAETDIRKTFARLRREAKAKQEEEWKFAQEREQKLVRIKR